MGSRTRTGALAATSVAALVASAMAASPTTAQEMSAQEPASAAHARQAVTRVVGRLDNVRQISFTASGRLLVSEAGHGRWNRGVCRPGAQMDDLCVGPTGRVRAMTAKGTKRSTVARRLPSARAAFESYAAGVAGVDKRPGGSVYASFSAWAPGKLAGRVVRVTKRGKLRVVARPRVNGQPVDLQDVVALRGQVLVLAGDRVLSLRKGKWRTWYVAKRAAGAVNPPVVVDLSQGADGDLYVAVREDAAVNAPAHVERLGRDGRILRAWDSTGPISAVTATSDGTPWVAFDGEVRRPDREPMASPAFSVPDVGSLAARGRHLYATAYSTSTRRSYPAGSPAGQVWRLTP